MNLSDIIAYHQRNAATAAARKVRHEAEAKTGSMPRWSRAQALTAEYQRRRHQEMVDALIEAQREMRA